MYQTYAANARRAARVQSFSHPTPTGYDVSTPDTDTASPHTQYWHTRRPMPQSRRHHHHRQYFSRHRHRHRRDSCTLGKSQASKRVIISVPECLSVVFFYPSRRRSGVPGHNTLHTPVGCVNPSPSPPSRGREQEDGSRDTSAPKILPEDRGGPSYLPLPSWDYGSRTRFAVSRKEVLDSCSFRMALQVMV